MVGLTWPLVLHPADTMLTGPFAPSIALSFELVPEALFAGESPHIVDEIGAPFERQARYLGWVLLLAAVPLSFLGPVRFASLVTLASPALSVLCMSRLLRARAPEGHAAARIFASFSFAFAPFYMANMANGELAKAQAWLLPLCLLVAFELRTRWQALPVLAGLLVLTGLSSPYLLVCVGLAMGVDALCSPGLWRRHLPALGALGLALGLTTLAFAQEGRGDLWLFSPTHRPNLTIPEVLVAPFAVAPLSALVWPMPEQTPSGLQHGIYLCWSVLLTGIWGAIRGRGVAGFWALAGILGALGPMLFLTPEWNTHVPLPMALLDALGTGLSSSGMYYRLLQVGLLGLALGIAHLTLPKWALAPLALVFATEVWLNQGSGLPLPTERLPHAEMAQAIAEDPIPGSVLELPGWPQGETNRPHAMSFRLLHGRPITALPRMPKHPVEYNLCLKVLDRCAEGGRCPRTPQTLERLEQRGVRFVVLHQDQGYETERLEGVLRGALGTPEVWEEALLWRVVPDPSPATHWGCEPVSGNLAPSSGVR